MNLSEKITDVHILRKGYVIREGYVFKAVNEANVYDAIVIRYPEDSDVLSPWVPFSKRSFKETIDFINREQIKKAIIIANCIEFLDYCPSLQYLEIHPSFSSLSGFDYSYLYKRKNLIFLNCVTEYGFEEQQRAEIDYSKIVGLKIVLANGEGHNNLFVNPSIEELWVNNMKINFSTKSCYNNSLKDLRINSCKINELAGIEHFTKLEELDLSYNKNLFSIDAIRSLRGTIKQLSIDHCPSVVDLTAIRSLEALETLSLEGNNRVPNIDFILPLKKLKIFIFTMNNESGNMFPCKNISYAYIKDRKHYNVRNSELAKILPG